jgi:hypothetical protein
LLESKDDMAFEAEITIVGLLEWLFRLRICPRTFEVQRKEATVRDLVETVVLVEIMSVPLGRTKSTQAFILLMPALLVFIFRTFYALTGATDSVRFRPTESNPPKLVVTSRHLLDILILFRSRVSTRTRE